MDEVDLFPTLRELTGTEIPGSVAIAARKRLMSVFEKLHPDGPRPAEPFPAEEETP